MLNLAEYRQRPALLADWLPWAGLVAPAGTPREVVQRLHAEVTRVLAVAEVRARIQGIGMEPVGDTPEQFSAHIRSEIERWGRVVRAAGVKAE